MNRIPPIMCAVCKKPVERAETLELPYKMEITVRVFCHGCMEETTLSQMDLMIFDFKSAVAFKQTALPESPKMLNQ